MSDSLHSRSHLPLGVRVAGWLALAGATPLAARLVWEQIFLTRARGPQMVGSSLIHIHGELFVVGLFFAFCLHIWLLILAALSLYRLMHGSVLCRADWVQVSVAVIVVGAFWVPYGAWQFATIEVAGSGPEGARQLSYAAINDQRYLVKALLRHGVPVDALDGYGQTALDGACRAKRVEVARYLISRGAVLDHAPDCRAVDEFAPLMKPIAPSVVPKSDRPQVPGTTIDVVAEPPPGWPPSSPNE